MHDMNIDTWNYEDVFNEVDDEGRPILKCLRFIEKDKKRNSTDSDDQKNSTDSKNSTDANITDYHYPSLRDFIESSEDLT